MGYFSDLDTLEWFWDIVKEEDFQRTKEVTPPSSFETPVKKALQEKVSCWFIKSQKQRETFQMVMFLHVNDRRLLKQWVQTKKESSSSEETQKNKRDLFEFGNDPIPQSCEKENLKVVWAIRYCSLLCLICQNFRVKLLLFYLFQCWQKVNSVLRQLFVSLQDKSLLLKDFFSRSRKFNLCICKDRNDSEL